jgi:ubiquinone/menaquinone biosynthesis C-methylase UbiE
VKNKKGYQDAARIRYQLEPYILEFADFENTKDLKILEIGIGLGADHQRFAEAGSDIYGIDLTERAVEYTRHRFKEFGLTAKCNQGDAEHLEFKDELFDQVYSWGVLHHSPDTSKAIAEVWRVLRVGGLAKIMIYHKWSLVGLMLWARYALFRLKP